MATLQDIKRRIRSVRNTRKITKAMELVAAARLRKAEERIVRLRDYADRMQELTAGTARAASSLRGLALLQQREAKRVAVVALTGDRGLAGAFNGQILRRAFAVERELRSDGRDVRWLAVGRKGVSTLRFRRYELEQSWTGFTDMPRSSRVKKKTSGYRRSSATSSTSRSRSRSSSGSCRSTSKPRSTAPCSSPRPQSSGPE